MTRAVDAPPGPRPSRKTLLLGLLFSGTMLSGLARAQETSLVNAPPPKIPIDGHGVDVTTGDYNTTIPLISVGPQGAGGLTVTRTFFGTGWRESYIGTLNSPDGVTFSVSVGGSTEVFTKSGSTYTSTDGGASTLTFDGANYHYTLADGTGLTFMPVQSGYNAGSWAANVGRLSQLKKPDGEIDAYTYQYQTICISPPAAAAASASPTGSSRNQASPMAR